MGKTTIEWTHTPNPDGTVNPGFTINPIRARNRATGKVGHFCEKISPGCGHCYASEWNEHRLGTGLAFLPVNAEKVELLLDHSKLREVVSRRKPTTFFWCDMTDLFLSRHPDEWIDTCFAAMACTPWHTHQVLTKRADRLEQYCNDPATFDRIALILMQRSLFHNPADKTVLTWPLPNVWLGVSVENQDATWRLDHLRRTPAAIRFVSFEPLLERVDARFPADPRKVASRRILEHGWRPDLTHMAEVSRWEESRIHQAIIGGESGPNARGCHVDYVRDLVRQCEPASVAPFVKQIGKYPIFGEADVWDVASTRPIRDPKGGDMAEWPADLRVRRFPLEVLS